MDIYYLHIDTPLGKMIAAAGPKGIYLLEFNGEESIENLKKNPDIHLINETCPYLDMLQEQLSEYFSGNRKKFDIPLDMTGTDFQKEVWAELLNIPYGETRSYAQQAASINKPRSVRAVANANGRNKIAIIIPCHRIIGTDGSLTGYNAGLEIKRQLLDIERSGLNM